METLNINILCSTDDNYVPYCGVMITSVFENNKDVKVCVYLLIDKPLSSRNSSRFADLAKKYDQQIVLLMVDKSLFTGFPLLPDSHFTIAVYYRLLAAKLLPNEIDKVVYLDCDIIVNDSLKSLWDIDLSDRSVAVVSDMCSGSNSNYERLQYPKSKNYFNSGVLLINLKYWRNQHLTDQLLNYIVMHKDRILWPDQDVLNAVLVDSKVLIPIKYNYQMGFLSQAYFDTLPQGVKEEVLTEHNPIIIHYNQAKPWSVSYYNFPYNGLWHKYKRESPWKFTLDAYPPMKRLNYFIKRWLIWPLGFMNNNTGTISL